MKFKKTTLIKENPDDLYGKNSSYSFGFHKNYIFYSPDNTRITHYEMLHSLYTKLHPEQFVNWDEVHTKMDATRHEKYISTIGRPDPSFVYLLEQRENRNRDSFIQRLKYGFLGRICKEEHTIAFWNTLAQFDNLTKRNILKIFKVYGEDPKHYMFHFSRTDDWHGKDVELSYDEFINYTPSSKKDETPVRDTSEIVHMISPDKKGEVMKAAGMKPKNAKGVEQRFLQGEAMNFKTFFHNIFLLKENTQPDMASLVPSDLFNFYYLETLRGQGRINNEYGNFIMKDVFTRTKNKYVKLFSHLVYNQIRKYIQRGRVDDDVTMELLDANMDNTKVLNDLMHKTYRSDMRRRNDVWNMVTEYLYKLSVSTSMKDIAFFIDRINNCIHNTRELLFSKFPNANTLTRAFDIIHNAQSLNEYKMNVSKDIRQIED